MEENTTMIESLLERAVEYGKTSFELAKLKAVDKTSDVVSSLISHWVVIIFLASFLLFLNLGLALWLGEVLGSTCYGFFVVAGFYGVTGVIIHFAVLKWIKRRISNHFIKLLLR